MILWKHTFLSSAPPPYFPLSTIPIFDSPPFYPNIGKYLKLSIYCILLKLKSILSNNYKNKYYCPQVIILKNGKINTFYQKVVAPLFL